MRVTPEQTAEQLVALQPPGRALPNEAGAVLRQLFEGVSGPLSRANNRAVDLAEESDPRATVELLADWERAAGLPDDCVAATGTVQERRAALVARLTGLGGQTPQFFIDLLAAYGYVIEIEEFQGFRAGQSSAGTMAAEDDFSLVWRVIHADTSLSLFAAGQSAAGEPLAAFGNASIECLINAAKPAHTVAIFASPQKMQSEDGAVMQTEDGKDMVEEIPA